MAAAGLVFISCSSDEPLIDGVNGYQDGKVSFLVELPGNINSRAMADGQSAKDLTYVVYDDAGTFLFQETVTDAFTNREADVRIPLVNGKSYKVAFFAKNSDAPYTITDGTLNIDYTNALANSDIYDAFYNVEPVAVSATMSQQKVTLTRPFGQLNVGATDWVEANRAGYLVEKTGLSFTEEVYTTMSLLDGTVSNKQAVTFGLNTLPDVNADSTPVKLNIDGAGDKYYYVASAYVLMPTDQSIVNTVNFNYTGPAGEVSLPVNTVPMQRNFRTNILGKFFTSDVEYHIVIDQNFGNPDLEVEIWDGKTSFMPALVEDTYIVKRASEWAGLVEYANSGEKNLLPDKKIVLANSIDFGGYPIQPLVKSLDNYCGIDLDGQGHTIKNFKVTETKYAGLLGVIISSNIRNLIISGASVSSLNDGDGNAYAGVLCSQTYGTVKIDNVTVIGSEVKGINKVGGIVGFVSENSITMTNSKVVNSVISNYEYEDESGQIGGLIGYIGNPADYTPVTQKVEKCSVTGSTMNVYMTRADRYFSQLVGIFDGNTGNTLVLNNNTVSGNTVNCKTAMASAFTPIYDPYCGGQRFKNGTVIIDGLTYDHNGNPQINIVDNTLNVDSPGVFAYAMTNMLSTLTAPLTINITADLDMSGVEYKHSDLGYNGPHPQKHVTINGNGHTISNLEVSGLQATLLPWTASGFTINNLNIKDSSFIGNNANNEYSCAAAFGAFCDYNPVYVNNCTLDNITVGNAKYVGGFVAYNSSSADSSVVEFDGCLIKNSYISSAFTKDGVNYQGHAGAYVGLLQGGLIKNSGVENVTFDVKGPRGGIFIGSSNTSSSKLSTGNWIKGVVGLSNYIGEYDKGNDNSAGSDKVEVR